MSKRFSVLDVLPTSDEVSPTESLRRAGALARHVDQLGYHRLWFAEHHGMRTIASAVPELLIAHVAPMTTHIRVGAGGVMLPNHSPLRVVEQYRTLHALHPGRIDLGIGRAAGTDPLTSHALAAHPEADFSQLFDELQAFATESFPKKHPFRKIRVTPQGVALPPIWMLGSSGGSASLAGEIGAGYAFAGHFSPIPAGPAVRMYKESFQPSAHFPTPEVMIAVSVICAEDAALAKAFAHILAASVQEMFTGVRAPIPTVEEALSIDMPERDIRRSMGPLGQQIIFGDPSRVKVAIEEAVEAAEADEVMVMTIIHDHEARLASYSLLADMFGVQPAIKTSPHMTTQPTC